jgi:outer membrane receptor for ferric coprogen and ferric-rhodotorulic acid
MPRSCPFSSLRFRSVAWRYLCALGTTAALAGVARAATPAGQPAADVTVVLSPFTVGSDRDAGYAATETLAGTRLRTDLRDVGASLTILTP